LGVENIFDEGQTINGDGKAERIVGGGLTKYNTNTNQIYNARKVTLKCESEVWKKGFI